MLSRVAELLRNGTIQNYLIVAPKSALGSWERDIEKFDVDEQKLLKKNGTFINYDKVWRKGFEKNTFDLIALDEAHYIKSRTSNRSKALLKMGTRAKYRYILTGSPISNGALHDIWSLYTFLFPKENRGRIHSQIFGSYYDFCDRYCILNQYHQPSQYVNVNELQTIINDHSYRVKKSECLDLPDKLPDEIIHVDVGEKSIYKRMMKESALLEYEIVAENPLSRRLKLRQVCSGFIQNEDELIELKCEKLKILEELVDGYPDDEKLVIFAHFKYSIRQIDKLLTSKKIKHVILDGEQKNKTIWRDFQNDPSIRVIVCQYQTANAGIDLFAASTIIYYEPTDRSVILEQSRDRIHRRGQTNKCQYIHLLTRGSVEIAMYNALSGFQDFNEKLFAEYMDSYRRSWV